MKQGYSVIAQNTKDSEGKTIDYVRMAYALVPIKHTQKGPQSSPRSGGKQRKMYQHTIVGHLMK